VAYAKLNSPLPNLTLSLHGCASCGSRECQCGSGLGSTWSPVRKSLGAMDLQFDTTYTDTGDLIPPEPFSPPMEPPTYISDLPLPNIVTPPLSSFYPPTIGTEFQLVGADQYLNIQTGQMVPMHIAQTVTEATTGSATSNVQTQSAQNVSGLVDPTTGKSFSGVLTNAAQILSASGQLVNAAGHLTAQGQALANQGQLIAKPAAVDISGAVSSIASWFTDQTFVAGVPNWGVLAGLFVVGSIVTSYVSSRPKRRRR